MTPTDRDEVATLRAQLADAQAGWETCDQERVELYERASKELTTIEQIAQGLADELREECRSCDNAGDCPSHRKLLAAFDAYQKTK